MPLTFRDMMRVPRISQPTVSPDGRHAAYTVAHADPDANSSTRHIHLVDLETGADRVLTPGPGKHHSPAFSPDGQLLAFVSDRDGTTQLWALPLTGGEARQVTTGTGGVGTPVWAPDSQRVAFERSVIVSPHLDGTADAPTRAQVYGLVNSKSSARVETALLYRHWDHWRELRRRHVHIVDITSGEIVDLTPGDRDAPPISLDSPQDYAFSPDGAHIAFVMNPDEVVARSTNNSIWLLPLDGLQPAGEPRNVSIHAACDNHPRFSPDGTRLAWLGMDKPVHEADKTRLRVLDLATGEVTTFLDDFDRAPHAFTWQDADRVVLEAQDRGRVSVYRLTLSTGAVRQLTLGTHNTSVCPIPGTEDLLVGRQRTTQPLDLFRVRVGAGIEPHLAPGPLPAGLPVDAGAEATQITRARDALADVTMNEAEELWYEGADDTLLHGFVIRPAGVADDAKVPLILLVHGGPQGAFADSFHYRWSAQVFASQGAAVAFLNPRGSTGYGQLLTDQISGDWGGRCYEDLMRGADVLAALPYVDGDRMCAAGASFGGYMVNWFLGHTNRFRALVSHDGIFHSETMAYSTEELWFEEVEHGGYPHTNPEPHARFSPHKHVGNFSTPTLVFHGEQDFRCPISEGLGLFTALQLQGVPSRFVVFPDEGHWVMQPANAEVWYAEVMEWLTEWLTRE